MNSYRVLRKFHPTTSHVKQLVSLHSIQKPMKPTTLFPWQTKTSFPISASSILSSHNFRHDNQHRSALRFSRRPNHRDHNFPPVYRRLPPLHVEKEMVRSLSVAALSFIRASWSQLHDAWFQAILVEYWQTDPGHVHEKDRETQIFPFCGQSCPSISLWVLNKVQFSLVLLLKYLPSKHR